LRAHTTPLSPIDSDTLRLSSLHSIVQLDKFGPCFGVLAFREGGLIEREWKVLGSGRDLGVELEEDRGFDQTRELYCQSSS
jgi:hypothetical protein